MTSKEKRIYAQYEKKVKEALDRWSDEPDAECKRCTPEHYWRSNNCDRCEETDE